MTAQVFLRGVGIGGYRSFGEMQRISPFGAVNLFAGANNCGKSNILRFLHEQVRKIGSSHFSSSEMEFTLNDFHRGATTASVSLAMPSSPQKWDNPLEVPDRIRTRCKEILESGRFVHGDGLVWFDYHAATNSSRFELKIPKLNAMGIAPVAEMLTKQTPTTEQHAATLFASEINPRRRMRPLPPVTLVPPIRNILPGDVQKNVSNGTGLIEELAKLEQFESTRPEDEKRFLRIQQFVRELVGDPNARLRIPHARKTIAIRLEERDLDIEFLGTGILQTVIMAAMGTVIENSIVCIEEPETHLHPILQRKLIDYLATNTTNQYFISTHSAHLLDVRFTDVESAVFRVRLENGQTRVTNVRTPGERWDTCIDLGCRASDVVQCNCIIWVEGPSDRVYVNHWIRACNTKLIEGIHYSIMFYGGGLLSHLSVADDNDAEVRQAVSDFIHLRRLNRNMVIIMDSDKDNSSTEDGEHKRRICREFENDGIAWITAGRTIENYLTKDLWNTAFHTVHPNKKLNAYRTYARMHADFKKISVANAAARLPAELNNLDLNERITALVAFIQKCNPRH